MIGIIITGHNRFASGMLSALRMIAGDIACVEAVDFLDGSSDLELHNQLVSAMVKLQECDRIVFACDLLGGAPFQKAATLTVDHPEYQAIYGINLGMLLELVLSGRETDDLISYLDFLTDTGRRVIGRYVYQPPVTEIVEEGI